MTPAREEQGMILITVLLFVALAAGVVALMLSGEDAALTRAQRMRDAAAAQAAVRGAEASAIVALRRDAVTAPLADHAGEPWAALAERGAKIQGGTFDLAIADAQGRFNINALASDDIGASLIAARIARALQLPPELALRAGALIRQGGPITDLAPLALFGLKPATLAGLARLATALPGQAPVNLNAASPELLAILLDNAEAAQTLVAVRTRQGYLTAEDFQRAGVSVPPGAGFTSDLFWVRARVTIGDTPQQLTSLLQRRKTPEGVEVVPIGRWRGAAVPEQAPALVF
ncbi:type II secretion system minor pseudopilin [Sphingomonas prati]|uniref:Type II secretion system protein K n=1 Tax=Sphingomonas prati TaxID=1843237 RepID=A0A7W9BQ93_9SPHN|nr:type II secretion system protein GspK [Sphingomonas prati]MBB5727658.1 general secretion pathway protein K [Sphingomonas prati]GGE79723.1 type II secretion system protein K [Sphingomonas prati]